MSKKEKKKSGRFGAFIGGSFFGFILGIGAVVGVCCFAYFKVSPNWINKTFKTNIDLGSDKTNNMTLKDMVGSVSNALTNLDEYTLDDLQEDFGITIKDKFKGIDITDLKTVPLKDLTSKLQSKLSQISIAELEVELFNISGDMEQILNSSYTYYFKSTDKKLYAEYDGSGYSSPITDSQFEYTYNSTSNKIEIKDNEFEIVDGEVEIPLRYLPITTALGNFNELTIADVLGFDYDKTSNKYYIDEDNNSQYDSGEEVSTIINALAGAKIEEMTDKINTLTLADMYAADEREGIFTLIDNPEKVLIAGTPNATNGEMSISEAFTKVIEDKNLGQLADADLINNDKFETIRTKWINKDVTQLTKNYVQVQDLTLDELLTISFSVLEEGDLLKSTKPSE